MTFSEAADIIEVLRDSAWASEKIARDCHRKHDAQREQLIICRNALKEAVPYIYNVSTDPQNAPWRREMATEILARVRAAIGEQS